MLCFIFLSPDVYASRVGRVSPKIRDLQEQLRKSQQKLSMKASGSASSSNNSSSSSAYYEPNSDEQETLNWHQLRISK